MPSPFPGMDPWLEESGIFPEVHGSLIIYLREAVNAGLPDGYVATSNRLVWVDPELARIPDVSAFGPADPPEGVFDDGLYRHEGMVAVAADPVTEPWSQLYLEILAGEGERLVTAIEVLSPSNKRPGDNGRTAYLQKQNEFRVGGVHLVEIDLLRGGRHTTAIPPGKLARVADRYDYHACVTVNGDPTRFYVKPFALADRLPTVVIPLDEGVTPVKVGLQPLLDRAYDTGLYNRLAKYARPCDPPLTPDQRAWAENILRDKGILK